MLRTGGTAAGGSGFTYSLVGGVLSVAPSATLDANDVGTNIYTMDVDDGTNTVTINVTITVLGNSGAITITNISPLAAGTVGAVYATVTLTATGGTGPYTYSVLSGALPAGLSLSPAGDITGTPTTAGTANFTVRAVDSLNDSGTKAFSLTVNAPSSGSSGGGGGGGGGGCAANDAGGSAWLALLGLLGLVALAIRTRKA
ncbi:MAG: putative Ig domain-containing protein [Planctomycetota bacterium]|nr:putative Ig domain-containing protein [Planctomycetota bacterium]